MHRITQWGEYGVHVVLYLARKSRDGSLADFSAVVGASEISEAQNIALNYTQQILLRLKSFEIVESVRGPKGGYRLAKHPKDISIQDILVATEGDTATVICESHKIEHENCNSGAKCSIKGVWYGLKDVINSYLSGITVSDLLDKETSESADDVLVHLPVHQSLS